MKGWTEANALRRIGETALSPCDGHLPTIYTPKDHMMHYVAEMKRSLLYDGEHAVGQQ